MSQIKCFVDIMEPRRSQGGIFKFMTQPWEPQKTMVLNKYTPQALTEIVADSVYIDAIIEAESVRTGVHREKLKEEVLSYLEEMAMDKKLHVIRWMGVVFLKISLMMKIGVFVNEPAILKVKASMGSNPVLFLPTHRSYADFCLMTYLCYHYSIDFPAVAAGMDFYSMMVLGRRMRETCAFYIRRTLVGAPLYAATLKQYVRTLVSKHSAPIEFFLEGTRSRSNKSLPPKYGMLSMSLMPLFAREVPDVTVVPVNISYDRLMEQNLFAYEHLGVPKPKESTGGFLKALQSLNDHFGNIYVNVGEPLSVKQYLGKSLAHTREVLKPVDLQQQTPEQFKNVQELANYVIALQQSSTIVTISNLVALVLMQSLMQNRALCLDEVVVVTEWMIQVLRGLGATVFENDVRVSVQRILVVHRKMMKLDCDGRLRLLSSPLMNLSADVKIKMKGHVLKTETVVNAVPIIQLQLYVNPVLLYLVPPAIVCIVAQRRVSREQLATDYRCIRKLLRPEFFHIEEVEDNVLSNALDYCLNNKVVAVEDGLFTLCSSEDNKLQYLLKWSIWPALTTVLKCADVMMEQGKCEHRQALKLIQERVESSHCHPYCLSLEAVASCLQGLVLAGALIKNNTQQKIFYTVESTTMEQCRRTLSDVMPMFVIDFGVDNAVILDQRTVVSRL